MAIQKQRSKMNDRMVIETHIKNVNRTKYMFGEGSVYHRSAIKVLFEKVKLFPHLKVEFDGVLCNISPLYRKMKHI